MIRGIRGAVAVSDNSAESILEATRGLLERMVEENGLDTENIAAVHFSATPDLNSAFPARAAREMGWLQVPLFCCVEIDVPGALPRCVRILILAQTGQRQDQVKHVYLGEASRLREL